MNIRTVARRVLEVLVVAGLMAAPAAAQMRGAAGQPPDRGERERQLLRMIEERFAGQVQRELLLSDEQMVRVRRVLTASAERHRQLEMQDRQLQQALREQLRPGVAAQVDSVSRLLDRITALRIEVAQVAREEMRELGTFLTPVQQAQYLLLRDRLRAWAQELRMQRAGPPRDGPP